MIEINAALAAVRDNLAASGLETLPIEAGRGRILAGDFYAPEPSPCFDNSAMDGFAVRWDDVDGAGKDCPVSLAIVGESRAGVPFAGEVGPGESVRISTGAMMPAGADTVVRVEDTGDDGGEVKIFAVGRRGQDVRYAGEEYDRGDLLLVKGTRLFARHLAILAAAGVEEVRVFARPRVAVLVTGSELVAAGENLRPGRIRDSNRIMIRAAAVEAGAEVVYHGRVGDDLAATVAAIETAMASAPDILVCAGGVSVGHHDHVRAGASRAGFAEIFWRVRQKPGKPLFLARRGDVLLFGLPGNPVSAYVCFRHYIVPALAKSGGGQWKHQTVLAVCAAPIVNRGKRPGLVRVRLGAGGDGMAEVCGIDRQGSHMLTSIVLADGYVHLAPGQELAAGDRVEVFLF